MRRTTRRLDKAARRIVTALRHGGPGALADVVREAVGWRYSRLRTLARQKGILGTTLASRRTATACDASVAAAEDALTWLRPPARDATSEIGVPLVGVVIPTFRDSELLPHALQSVVNQTYPHWHCVVVDDASPEDVGSAIARFRGDKRITYLRHGANRGLPAARNTGLRALDVDMVLFLDADDMLVPRALEHAVDAFVPVSADPAVAGVHGQVIQVPEEATLGDLTSWRGSFRRPVADWSNYTGDCPFNVHSALVRKSVLDASGGFDESLVNGAEDWDLWFRLLRHGYRFLPSDQLVGAYRQRRESMIRRHGTVHLERAKRLLEATEEWAELDPDLVVGRGAAAPLSRARLSLARAKRAASVLGLEIVQSGSLDPLTTSPAFSLLDPTGVCEGQRDPIVESARRGAVRGLGLSVAAADQLSEPSKRKLDHVADIVAKAVLDASIQPEPEPGTFDATSRTPEVSTLFLAESAADVRVLEGLLTECPSGSMAVDLEILAGDSGANSAWRDLDVPILPYHQATRALGRVRLLVAVSPAGPVSRDLIAAAQRCGAVVHLLQPDGRALTLDVNPASECDHLVVSRTKVAASLAKADGPTWTEEASTGAPSGWRGSDYPARLPYEDGPIHPPSIELLRDLRNSRVGETAVIIGNGPSLNETELEILTDTPTFGVNGIFLAADRLPKPITYYVVEDTSVLTENLDDIKAFRSDWKFFPAMYRKHFRDDEIGDNTAFFRMNSGFYGRTTATGSPTGTLGQPRFSMDATQRLYCGQSVTIINLQLAHWMGFTRVVLVGMDFSYTIPEDAERKGAIITSHSDDPNHFDPRYFGAGKTWKDPQLDRVLVNYALADELYRATDREIINATVGGRLELFPRKPLREAIGY